MSPLDCAILVVVTAAPFLWLVHWQLGLLDDPRYLRTQGVVIVADRVLEERSAPIGEYLGCPIWGTVTFKGMLYRFDRVIDARRRERIKAGELYLEPGLVYVTE